MYQTHIYGRFTLCFSRFSKLSSTQSASQFAEEPQRWQTAAPARWEIAAGCQAVTFSDRDSWIWSTNSARCEGFEVRWRDSTLGKPHSPAEFDSLPLQVEVNDEPNKKNFRCQGQKDVQVDWRQAVHRQHHHSLPAESCYVPSFANDLLFQGPPMPARTRASLALKLVVSAQKTDWKRKPPPSTKMYQVVNRQTKVNWSFQLLACSLVSNATFGHVAFVILSNPTIAKPIYLTYTIPVDFHLQSFAGLVWHLKSGASLRISLSSTFDLSQNLYWKDRVRSQTNESKPYSQTSAKWPQALLVCTF